MRHFHSSLTLLTACTALSVAGAAATSVPAQAGTTTTAYSFTGSPDGQNPTANVVLDAAGNIYGETNLGGADGLGTVFKFAPATGTLTPLLTFDSTNGRVGNGNMLLHGATLYGSAPVTATGQGIVFSIKTDGTHYTVLHEFNGTDGAGPQDQPALAPDGTLYGTTRTGGPSYGVGGSQAYGVLYSIAPNGTFSILHAFADGADGREPTNIAIGPNGTIYGSTNADGAHGGGVVYSYVPSTGAFTVLHSFGEYGVAGQPFLGGLYRGVWLFGSTTSGGANKDGTLFAMRTNGTGYHLLWSFNSAVDGAHPQSPPILTPNDTLIGTTTQGPGISGYGTLYEYHLNGPLNVLNAFTFVGANGEPAYPYGSPAEDSAGTIYGTTQLGGSGACSSSGCGTIYHYAP